jgi:hypothetical protein
MPHASVRRSMQLIASRAPRGRCAHQP